MSGVDAEALQVLDQSMAVGVIAHDRHQRGLGSQPGDVLGDVARDAAERALRHDGVRRAGADGGQGAAAGHGGQSASPAEARPARTAGGGARALRAQSAAFGAATDVPPKRVSPTDPAEGVKDADVVVTAAWNTAPGTPESERRLRDFAGFQVTGRLMEGAKPDAMLLHCLPAHRGEEISTAVFEEHADEIFDEAENRLHVQKAVLAILLANR